MSDAAWSIHLERKQVIGSAMGSNFELFQPKEIIP